MINVEKKRIIDICYYLNDDKMSQGAMKIKVLYCHACKIGRILYEFKFDSDLSSVKTF